MVLHEDNNVKNRSSKEERELVPPLLSQLDGYLLVTNDFSHGILRPQRSLTKPLKLISNLAAQVARRPVVVWCSTRTQVKFNAKAQLSERDNGRRIEGFVKTGMIAAVPWYHHETRRF